MELWTLPAEELLQAGDVGLIPWVPLTDFADPPETTLQRCREAIETHAPPAEKANLLAVTQVFSFLRHNNLAILTVLGGKEVMLEIPFLDEIVMEKTRETLDHNAHHSRSHQPSEPAASGRFGRELVGLTGLALLGVARLTCQPCLKRGRRMRRGLCAPVRRGPSTGRREIALRLRRPAPLATASKQAVPHGCALSVISLPASV